MITFSIKIQKAEFQYLCLFQDSLMQFHDKLSSQLQTIKTPGQDRSIIASTSR
jgi:hypothetical protein